MSTQHKFIYKHDEACYLGERYPQHEIVIQSSCDDLNADEILQLFKSYMVACGYAEKSFYDACETAAEENPYRRKGGNRYEMGETQWGGQVNETLHHTKESWHSGGGINATDQIKTNRIKDMLS